MTDRKALGSGASLQNLLARIQSAAAAGVDWIQIREKDLPGRELLGLARGAVETVAARIIVNDRLDVALAAGAAGVHLGHESVPAAEVVRWRRAGNAPAGFLVGVSCHSLKDAKEAEMAGADYVIFGPVFETPSKAAFGAPQGVAALAAVCAAIRLPVIAIGGIDEENAPECLRAGAAGIAAIRLLQEPADAAELRRIVERLHSVG
ncbi:MAG TPA: thiamine phosphate synthase [Candidatus Sulfotelmatobacter sp.]|nr:thiamine phosphate synthase [Candidatus Sulfotelmatobacter sp.]